jgi:hypothetical protein
MRRLILLCCAVWGLAGCAGLGGPRVVTLTPQAMSERLAREFPLDRRLLEIVDVRVSDPRLKPEPDSGRLRADFRVQATERLSGARFDTTLGVLAGLRWQASDGTLRLERVDLDLPPPASREPQWWLRVGSVLGSRVFDDRVVWRAPADSGLTVERITVTAAGVELRLVPVR